MLKDIVRRYEMHPISVHTLYRGENIVGLRLICIYSEMGVAATLYEWKKFINNSTDISFMPEVYSTFSQGTGTPLVCLDLNSKAIWDIMCKYGLQNVNMIKLPCDSSVTRNYLKLDASSETSFISYLYMLCPQLAAPFTPIGTTGLFISAEQSKIRILSNGVAPLCYLKQSIAKHILSGGVTLESNMLKIGTLEQRMILLEGRARHLPVNLGYEMAVNRDTGNVSLYMGTIKNNNLLCKTQTFENRVFEWVVTSSTAQAGVCGSK